VKTTRWRPTGVKHVDVVVDEKVAIPWNWMANSVSVKLEVEWDPERTEVTELRTRLETHSEHPIPGFVYDVGAKAEMNDKEVGVNVHTFDTRCDRLVDSRVQPAWLVRRGLNYFVFTAWKTAVIPFYIEVFFTLGLDIYYEGDEPGVAPPVVERPPWWEDWLRRNWPYVLVGIAGLFAAGYFLRGLRGLR